MGGQAIKELISRPKGNEFNDAAAAAAFFHIRFIFFLDKKETNSDDVIKKGSVKLGTYLLGSSFVCWNAGEFCVDSKKKSRSLKILLLFRAFLCVRFKEH